MGSIYYCSTLYLKILILISLNHVKFEASGTNAPIPAVYRMSNKTVPLSSKIIGGNETGADEFKFIVKIEGYYFSTAGAIIGPKWIITARHTMVEINKDNEVENFRTKLMIFPKYTNNQHENGRKKFYTPVKFFCHPFPDQRQYWRNSDIGLMKLSEDIPLGGSDGLRAIEIASDSDTRQKDLPLRIAGWGLTHPREKSGSGNLMAINTYRMPDYQCDAIYNIILPQVFCAGEYAKTVCHGDSGGPAITKSKHNGKELLVGTVMGGPRDCSIMGVLINVSYYKPWIEKVMKTEDPKFECSSLKPKTKLE